MYERWLVNLMVEAGACAAVALCVLLHWPEYGHIVSGGEQQLGALGLLDSVYLSAITYTTVGFGDVVPVGPIRFL